jgi:hypothetical protein
MKVFIGNNTRQNARVHYRLPEMKPGTSPYSVFIPKGAQETIPHDLTSTDLDYILRQIPGVIEAGAVDRTREYFGFTYRVEKPITEQSLQTGVEKNVEGAVKRSNDVFVATGVGLADSLAQRAAEEGNNLLETSLSVQEDFMGAVPKGVISKGIKATPRGVRAN